MKFEALLTRNVRGFWATTYSFGLKLFDQYLLRRLSQSPLNAAVLVDREKLAEVWERIPEGDGYLAGQAGRRYLLRGVRPPSGGAFHPKTYLFSRPGAATLLVGSGNLTPSGIDRGRETFVSFSSERVEDLPTMRAWGAWMSRLVVQQEDEVLRGRWAAMREQCEWLGGPVGEGSQFLVNEERALLDQLRDHLVNVSELHLTAPFFDREAEALRELIATCDPRRVVMYLGEPVKVEGKALAAALESAREVRLRRFEPRQFVHAKAIGAVDSDGSGVLLLGSPNLSRAALTRTYGENGSGNCEAAVLREGSNARVVGFFERSGMELGELSPEALLEYEFGAEDEEETAVRSLVLRSASWRGDGRIELHLPGAAPAGARLTWLESDEAVALDEEGATVEPLAEREPAPAIAWLLDPTGESISNRVAVEDPRALEETLTGSAGKRHSRPRELEGLEAVPLVRMMLWLNDKFIYDLDANEAVQRAQRAAVEKDETEDNDEFWRRYTEEELGYDPRSQTYRPLTPGSGGESAPLDELLRELETLSYLAPRATLPALRLLGVVPAPADREGGDDRGGTPWTTEARQQLRGYRLLLRWCDAVGDPRLRMLGESAPALNYQTLLGVVDAAWIYGALEPKRLRHVLRRLLAAFIGGGEGEGFLGTADAEQREQALGQLNHFAIEAAAGLAAVALDASWRHDVYDWQPLLQRGLDLEVLLPGEASVRLYSRLTGKSISVPALANLLESRITWVDDATWCERLAADLELKSVRLDLHRRATVRAAVQVRGAGEPLRDGRLLTVARRAVEFKDLPAIAILCDGATLILEPRHGARALIDGVSIRSPEPVTLAQLQEIEGQGGSWADLLATSSPAAAQWP